MAELRDVMPVSSMCVSADDSEGFSPFKQNCLPTNCTMKKGFSLSFASYVWADILIQILVIYRVSQKDVYTLQITANQDFIIICFIFNSVFMLPVAF